MLDPVKVTRLALQNAASVASLLLTTECVIAEEKEDAQAMPPMGGGGGMGGMYQDFNHFDNKKAFSETKRLFY